MLSHLAKKIWSRTGMSVLIASWSLSALHAQVGMSKKQDVQLIGKDNVEFSSVKKTSRVLNGIFLIKNGIILNYQRDFSDHPGLYAQEYIPGDFYDVKKYKLALYQFLKIVLDKSDFELAKSKIVSNKFDNYTEFNIDIPGYSEFIVNIRIDPHGINFFLSYYSAA